MRQCTISAQRCLLRCRFARRVTAATSGQERSTRRSRSRCGGASSGYGALMAETEFTLRVEREDGETLILKGLALARAFFTGDPSAKPGGYDSLAGSGDRDRIVVEFPT